MTYRIKTVSRLTGIPRNTLLAWERRYDLIEPARSDNGYREYSDVEVATLTSVKELIDQGYRISEAVELVKEVQASANDRIPAAGTARIAMLSVALRTQLDAAGPELKALSVVRDESTLDRFMATPISPGVDVVVVELELLGERPRTALQRVMQHAGARHAIVVHTFAASSVLRMLVRTGVRLVQGPPRAATVMQSVRELVALQDAIARTTPPGLPPLSRAPLPPIEMPPEEGPLPAALFSPTQLAQLRERQSSVECECPNHLAALVSALQSFEAYSESCEDRSDEDAVLHAYLHRHTARARRVVEDMLLVLCEQEGITL